MRKLILMSVIILPLVISIRCSNDRSPKHGLHRAVVSISVFLVLWSLLGPHLFFLFSAN